MKRLAIIGSTGSIGRQVLEVVRAFPDRFSVTGLAAGRNRELLGQQVREFRPRIFSLEAGPDGGIPAAEVSLEQMVSDEAVDLVVIATAGKAGLGPTLAALRAGKDVALANKEVLVMAGEIVMAEARRGGVSIRPVDSEHSAVWQCLLGESGAVRRLFLTASGGPFYRLDDAGLAAVTPAQALKHPTWKMGPKVTVDSATLMNKGLEVIEAHWLFDLPLEGIEVLVHPQSVVHALVEFQDGSVKAQLAYPDMRLPIQYALCYPDRLPNAGLPHLDLAGAASLTFEPPDLKRFPCLALAVEAGRRGGTYPAVLCAADEVAVQLFLDGKLGFTGIARLVEEALDRHNGAARPALPDILAADSWAREITMKIVTEVNLCS